MSATAQLFTTTYEGPDSAVIHHDPTGRTFFVRWERAVDQCGQIVDRMTRLTERLGDSRDVATWRWAADVDLGGESVCDLSEPDYRSPDDLVDAAEAIVLRLVTGSTDSSVSGYHDPGAQFHIDQAQAADDEGRAGEYPGDDLSHVGIKVHVEQTAVHTYLTFYTKSHSGDTFGHAGKLCMSKPEAQLLLTALNARLGIAVVSGETDLSGPSWLHMLTAGDTVLHNGQPAKILGFDQFSTGDDWANLEQTGRQFSVPVAVANKDIGTIKPYVPSDVSGYSVDVEHELPGELDFCFVCWRERADCYCRESVLAQMIDPDYHPADCNLSNGLLGYDPLDTVVGFEKLVAK